MATRRKVYEKFGETAEMAQLFETALGTAVLCAEGFNKGWHLYQDGAEAAKTLTDIDGSTLGNIVRRFDNLISVSESGVIEQFRRALKARNRLVHGFYEKHNFLIDTPEGRDAMIVDLNKIHEEISRSHGLAFAISETLLDNFREWAALRHQDTST